MAPLLPVSDSSSNIYQLSALLYSVPVSTHPANPETNPGSTLFKPFFSIDFETTFYGRFLVRRRLIYLAQSISRFFQHPLIPSATVFGFRIYPTTTTISLRTSSPSMSLSFLARIRSVVPVASYLPARHRSIKLACEARQLYTPP
jgi:hypothetical protein